MRAKGCSAAQLYRSFFESSNLHHSLLVCDVREFIFKLLNINNLVNKGCDLYARKQYSAVQIWGCFLISRCHLYPRRYGTCTGVRG